MKVITPKEMASLESLAYLEGASDLDFMESAGFGIAASVETYIQNQNLGKHILLLCGKGNNAGDAYVAGIYLLKKGYRVSALQTALMSNCAPLCQKNHGRFLNAHGVLIEQATLDASFFSMFDLIIDGIFGTGFKGTVENPFAFMIEQANQSKKPIIAIDIPSGFNGEIGKMEGIAIQAAETIFLGLPKSGFFIRDGWNYTGNLTGVEFGLPTKFIDQAKSMFNMLTINEVKNLLPPLVRNRHKYQAGYVVGLSGSPEFPGAALLSSLAVLRGGAGMVRLLHPEGMQTQLITAAHEIIKTAYSPKDIKGILVIMQKASALFLGPGLGLASETQKLLQDLIPTVDKPCVLDADALNFIATHDIHLPSQAILTPHIGEMARLLKMEKAPHEVTKDFLKTCQEYAEKEKVTLILKGGPTFIFQQGKEIQVNPFGDPGMATAGSGDVLTGLLAALLAQGLPPHEAACLGVAFHGLAGQLAAQDKTSYSMIASDILDHFSHAFKILQRP